MTPATAAPCRRLAARSRDLLLRLTFRGATTNREVMVYATVVTIVGAAVLLEHVLKSGFYADDYYYRTAWLAASHGSFWRGVADFYNTPLLHGRPSLGFYLSLLNEVLGSHQREYSAWSAALACFFSVSVYVLLRALRMRRLDAGLIGLLVLVFPDSDATRAWPILGDAQVAMSFVLIGVACSVSSLSRAGRRALPLRIVGLCLIAIGVTVYELTFGALFLTFLLYRTRVGWRRAFAASVPDWVLLILIYVLFTHHTELPRIPSSQIPGHTWQIATNATTLLTRHVLFFGSSAAGLVAIALIVVASMFLRRRRPVGDVRRAGIDRWLATLAVAIVMTAAAYAIYAPALSYYQPLASGLYNRTNAFAAVPLLVIAYAIAALVGLLLFQTDRLPNASTTLTAAIACALGIGYTIGISHDLRLWDSAYRRAQATLSGFRARVPSLPSSSLVLFDGQPFEEAKDIPIWSFPYDLGSALQLEYHNLTIRGVGGQAIYKVNCMRHEVNIMNTAYPTPVRVTISVPYGRFYMYQTNTGAIRRPLSQKQCLRQAPTFTPGPYDAPDPGADDPSSL